MDLRRLNKKVNKLFVLQFICLLLIAFILFNTPAVLNNTTQVYQKGSQGLPGIEGAQGLSGKDAVGLIGTTGDTGASGTNGVDGKQGAQGEAGTPGQDGQPGADGKSMEFRNNDATCMLQYKYTTSRTWTDLTRNPDCEPTDG